MNSIELEAERALFEGKLQGMVLTCFQNERPLRGLAGLLDWRFEGAISQVLRAGFVTGKPGECAYLPIQRNGKTFHLFLGGGGHLPSDGKRGPVPAETLKALA